MAALNHLAKALAKVKADQLTPTKGIAAPAPESVPVIDSLEWDALKPGLRKIYAYEAAASDPKLSGGDLRTFIWICSHAAAATGIAYPSHSTLSRLTGLTRRAVINSTKNLEKLGYIQVLQKGAPGRSNRYRVTFKNAKHMKAWKNSRDWSADCEDDEGADKNVSDERQFTTGQILVNVGSVDGERKHANVVNSSADEPTHRPEGQPEGKVVGSTVSTAAPGRGGAGRTPSLGVERDHTHQWFWNYYPKRRHVAETNRLLSELLKAGEAVGPIQDGARKYAEYVKAKNWHDDKYIIEPRNWLNDQRWLDDWSIPPPPIPKPRGNVSAGKSSTKSNQSGPKKKTEVRKVETAEEKEERLNAQRAKTAKRNEEFKAQQQAEKFRQDEMLELAWRTHGSLQVRLTRFEGSFADHLYKIVWRGVKPKGPYEIADKFAREEFRGRCSEIAHRPAADLNFFRKIFGEWSKPLIAFCSEYISDLEEASENLAALQRADVELSQHYKIEAQALGPKARGRYSRIPNHPQAYSRIGGDIFAAASRNNEKFVVLSARDHESMGRAIAGIGFAPWGGAICPFYKKLFLELSPTDCGVFARALRTHVEMYLEPLPAPM